MRSPFPGMDPWLEDPEGWHPFHTLMVVELARQCAPRLPEDYYVTVESRTYVIVGEDPEDVQLPDALVVERRPGPVRTGTALAEPPAGLSVTFPAPLKLEQRYLVIRRKRGEERRVVTAIEILSPSNKRSGTGRNDYEEKRLRVLTSLTNLVEIDLLRFGPRIAVSGVPAGADYSVLISRAHHRPTGQLLPIGLRDRLPDFPLPLLPDESGPVISLSAILDSVYENGRYDLQIDYRLPAVPPLRPDDQAWADALLRERGLR